MAMPFHDPPATPRGFIIAAPRTGSGKTLFTLGLIAALRRRGLVVAPAKTGPDYIDAAILSRVAGRDAVNLDPWAMPPDQLHSLASTQARGADLLVIEGVMGLFDGAADGSGSTADLAAALSLPVLLVIDAAGQGQSIAALASGFAYFRPDVQVAGIILNRVSGSRHEQLLREALAPLDIPVLGVLPRNEGLALPSRHLGLVMPDELASFDSIVEAAASIIADTCDIDGLLACFSAVNTLRSAGFHFLPPLGQHIAIARDAAFCFLYRHILDAWHTQGATLSWFSPLADEYPAVNSDAVFLPGGYPELHGSALASAKGFHAGMRRAADSGALIYGECGGYMVLGTQLTDRAGDTHEMLGLLPHATDISKPRLSLGYRQLTHNSPLPWPARLRGHEFHYSTGNPALGSALFTATDARGHATEPMGAIAGRVMGSYAHVIGVAA
jgi:cobyrinic acid a,c-diamide synthase